ncbi:MAG: hypothetical protein HZB55_02595 [Deltaproteobacteria bacterium]|nr:hypothetical protein [Deltaproteobacteria bacterium]
MTDTANDLLTELRAVGVRAFLGADGALNLDAPKGALTPDLLARVQAEREGICQALRGPEVVLWPGTPPRIWPRWRQEVAGWPLERRRAWASLSAAYQRDGFPRAAADFQAAMEVTT